MNEGVEKMKWIKYLTILSVVSPGLGKIALASGCAEPVVSSIPPIWWIAPGASVIALIFAFIFYQKVIAEPEGTEKMITIAGHVREGAYAYLFRQYKHSTLCPS